MEITAVKTVQGQKPMQVHCIDKFYPDKDVQGRAISIFPDIKYQNIYGFGGAFTEAAAVTLNKLSSKNKKIFYDLYFDEEKGIKYNFGRIHMNSCDFSLGNYSCTENGDKTLETFNIERDKKYVIPMIKKALEYGDIKILMSPWSPPAYMKTNGEMNNGGKLKEEYKTVWAEHFVKFIEEYKKQGINMWAATVQNEPMATQIWDSCVYTAEEERDFVKNHLGKKLADSGVKLFFWDHNKEFIIDRARVMLSDKEAAKYIYGLAFHWYCGEHFEQLEMFNKCYPDKVIAFTEGCYEYSLGKMDTVKIGERYAHDMIGSFNNYCSIFCDWNLLLDEIGGPNHVGNFCDAPIMADTKNDKLIVRDSYYYIGHFSKFVELGAVRIGSSKWNKDIETVSFKNPNGEIVTVVLNQSENDFEFFLRIEGKIIETISEKHSITTYIFKEN